MRTGLDTSRLVAISEIGQAISAGGEDPDNFDLDSVFEECYVWDATRWVLGGEGDSLEQDAALWESVARHDHTAA